MMITRLIYGDTRLKLLSLQSLELLRLYNDLTRCYKIVFGLVDINCNEFFQLKTVLHNKFLSLKR